MNGDPRPASSIEPGWQVYAGGEWLTVKLIAETERTGQPNRLWFVMTDDTGFVADVTPFETDDLILSRPPEASHA